MNLVPRRGRLVAWDGSENVDECVSRAFCPVERYGFGEPAYWRLVNVRLEAERSSWAVLRDGRPWSEFQFALAGEHNLLNATAAAATAAGYGIGPETIARAFESFRSVKRRLEVRAEVAGVTIIDDFAHHPTAIAVTLKALRERYAGRLAPEGTKPAGAGGRLWAILEPRSNTLRRNVFQQELIKSLSLADEAVLAKIFRPEAVPAGERLDEAAVISGLVAAGKRARLIADADAIVETVVPELRAGDVVAILSNGGFGGIYEKLPARLKTQNEVSPKT